MTIEELTQFLNTAIAEKNTNRLLYRGEAWSLMREEGILPTYAPNFGVTIETDLADYGFALLWGAMNLRAKSGQPELINKAFEQAAKAFESLVRNGVPHALDRGFFLTLAASAYHLAGFSAVAYSLLNEISDNLNTSPCEMAIRHLILRDILKFSNFIREQLEKEDYGDKKLSDAIIENVKDIDEVVSIILNSTIFRGLAYFEFSLETGDHVLIEKAKKLLRAANKLANNAQNVPFWWISKLCFHLIDDLWHQSLHENLPTKPPDGTEGIYPDLRQLFISSLFIREKSEVELWPSQLEAANRSTDLTDDLVVALPTSAGKTRVAEIVALMTLSSERRVLIVTPLRALSAQTERSFRHTFAPLGFTVSSLYGASGLSDSDEDTLQNSDIIIATPEKLDFALRSKPTLVNDVGLIVLDEGHMIGPEEREIRYETLVQRLLCRSDADNRRIVCLSAVLPSGIELNDLTSWIRSNTPGEPVLLKWRPTRQRFGTLYWRENDARLLLDYNKNIPFLDKFVVQIPAKGKERIPYPRKNSQLTIFAAWEFAARGKRTLIYSTQANWVESYGKNILNLCKRKYLASLLEDETSITRTLEVGIEWLGEDHVAIKCLKVGVALHYGQLPNPYLRELENLLNKGVLKVIIASPTLAQGLNLNAAVLMIPTLTHMRNGRLEKIKGEEFANVAGRAGRAFVDVEGLIVHTIFDNAKGRINEWRKLVNSAKARTLKSGLIQIVAMILDRLSSNGVLERDDAWEYLANSRKGWQLPQEEGDINETIDNDFFSIVERLDITVFGLIEALDSDHADLPMLLDEALKGSLWARQILREDESVVTNQRKILASRANLIWKTTSVQERRGHFAMGIGLESGLAIDDMAEELNELLDLADNASITGEINKLINALWELGERLLFIQPFTPDNANTLSSDWKSILRCWVSGEEVSKIGVQDMKLVEDVFTYRFVWALEAIRIRRMSHGWSPETVAGGAAAVVETGVPNLMMAMLIRAGLPSRQAAIAAIEDTNPVFITPSDMRNWLESDEILAYTESGVWPTPNTAKLWSRFRTDALKCRIEKWTITSFKRKLDTSEVPNKGLYRIINNSEDSRTWLATPDYKKISAFETPIVDPNPSLLSGRILENGKQVKVLRIGSGNYFDS